MTSMRHPSVAGLFYPAAPEELRRVVRSFVEAGAAASESPGEGPPPKAIVAPHAGYVYSGPVAGAAYARIAPLAEGIRRVVLFGPSHRLPFRGLAYSNAEAFLTPLGQVTVDRAAYAEVADLPQVQEYEAPFEGEHCLEVQLPFLQLTLDDFRIVPFLVGDAGADEVAAVMERLWGGAETLILVSSDLSHYLDYDSAKAIDSETSHAIETLRADAITHRQACGRTPLAGLLQEARRHGLHARTLDLRSSGDTAGPRERVVGYGAYAFS